MTKSTEKMMLKDGLIDTFNNYHMGITENVFEKWNISREERTILPQFSEESTNCNKGI